MRGLMDQPEEAVDIKTSFRPEGALGTIPSALPLTGRPFFFLQIEHDVPYKPKEDQTTRPQATTKYRPPSRVWQGMLFPVGPLLGPNSPLEETWLVDRFRPQLGKNVAKWKCQFLAEFPSKPLSTKKPVALHPW